MSAGRSRGSGGVIYGAEPVARKVSVTLQFVENSAEIVRDYERDADPLHSIPPRLLADAEALGWRGLARSRNGGPPAHHFRLTFRSTR